MRGLAALTWLEIHSRRRRILALLAFSALYLVAAIAFRALATGEHGQVEPDALFSVGGYALVSTMLLSGWTIGRFPLVIALVLLHGIFSSDVTAGYTRVYASTRVRLLTLYGFRLLLLLALAFLMSAVLLPAFDAIMLGKLSGSGIFVLIAAYLLVFGSLTVFFSVFTRADAWCTIFVFLGALVWHAMLRGGLLADAPVALTQAVTMILPPQGALNAIEDAFGMAAPIPWSAFLYVCAYSALLLVIAGVQLTRREI
ncbi:MAG TPA: hypothetical protein VF035_02940 [Longimicrobiales bacterium]